MRTPATELPSGGACLPDPGRGDRATPAPAIFIYGTLLDAETLASKAGDPALHRRALAATLAGYRRALLRGTPYPTLLPAPGGVVHGLLIRPTARALARLRAYEGPPYRLVPLRVETRHGARRARAWVVPRWRAG